ncbi:unnamed protein product [Adineta ricciae]|uniref:Uncharacterized protein n=1 Tax=Adineta ricciae TaxID=249248 RepID=A0A815KCL9_ADIRI|nr:unnamed protein product [Adineta ricciae]
MINPKVFFIWIYKQVSSYNLFILDQHDYENDDTIKDPVIILRKQKYKTRLYIVLLAVCLYILFYGICIKMESETIVISNVTPDNFDQLYNEYDQTLSCPCSTIAISYKNFVSNNIIMHPVCSSYFVDKKWIEGLYFANASRYNIQDFRKVAYSQFELLSRLCSLSQSIKSQIQSDIDNTELVSMNVLSKKQIQLEIDNTIEFQKNNAFNQMISFLNYWRTTIQRNFLISALGTNAEFYAIDQGHGLIIFGYQISYIVYDNGSSIQCGLDNPVIQATFFSISNDSIDLEDSTLMSNYTNINGFVVGCTPFDALLQSTLECLYEFECIQLLFNYFPNLNQTNFNWNTSILSSGNNNNSILFHFQNLFIENWLSNVNYSSYFAQCSSSMCTYTTINRRNLSYAITVLISLYGGLIIILRLIVSYFIDLLFKYKNHSENQNTQTMKPFQFIKQLNLFKNINERSETNIKQQRIITRVYLILLIGSIITLCLFNSLNTEITIISISNPSLTSYNLLESKYSTTLQCPCGNQTIPYKTFLSISPIFHQICLSGFVTTDWIEEMINSMMTDHTYDWRVNAYKQFQILSDLCQLANQTINIALNQFLLQSFISSSIINQMDLNTQIYTSLNQFYQSTTYNFALMKDIIQIIQQVNQFHEGILVQTQGLHPDPALTMNTMNNKSDFILYGVEDINSELITCVCATNPSCQRVAVVSDDDAIDDFNRVSGYGNIHNLSGWIESCLARNSILFSSLQCLYKDSNCFLLLMSYIRKIDTNALSLLSSSTRLQPLDYNPINSRFPPNTTISILVEELMIEQWNPILSYEQFYESCAPLYCLYSQSVRKQNFLGVIITLISMIGGIVVSLRIFTPRLIKFTLKFLDLFKKKSQEIQHNDGNRLVMMLNNILKFVRTTFVELNIFSIRDFGNNIDRVTITHYGRWATRLYIVLLLTSLTILIFYTIFQSRPITNIFNKPSFIYYNSLKETYGDELKCSCSRIASTYNQFVNIQPEFHSICSSQFVSDEWRIDLTNGLVLNLSVYDKKDYRRFLSAHLQYLQELCRLSIQTVNNSINNFLTSLLVSNQLLSQNNFQDRLTTLIEQSKSSAPTYFSHLLFFTQSIIHGNAFESVYGSNFEYILTSDDYDLLIFYTEPIIYDNNCSCGLFPNCTTQASFINTNTSVNESIKGMKIGCTPSESLLVSTLECFYDQSCLDLIRQYTNFKNLSEPLTLMSSRFLQNTTIDELIQNLFIEKWSTSMFYSLYYEQCSPLLCSFTSIEQFNVFYIITVILGLQGGLTIVLKWICPKLIQIGLNIYENRKKRINSIRPVVFIKKPSETIENNVIPSNRSLFKIIGVIVSLTFIFVCVIIFSIYYARQNKIMMNSMTNVSIRNNLSTTMSVPSSTSELVCQLKVRSIPIDPHCYPFANFGPYVIADLNNDHRLDFVFSCENGFLLQVLLANSDGSFGDVLFVYMIGSVLKICVGDVNNDAQVDLILVISSMGPGNVYILFGNGNGTFQTQNVLLHSITSRPTDVNLIDINNDTKLDLISVSQYINEVYVFFGNGDGTFASPLKLFMCLTSDANQLAISDFDNDGYLDIAAMNTRSLHIHVFLRNTDGSFQSEKALYTAFDTFQFNMITGYFDNDHQADIVYLHSWENTVAMFYRYDNKTFHLNQQIVTETSVSLDSRAIVTYDLNSDSHLDLILGLPSSNEIYGLLGDGNGNFQTQIIYSSIINNSTDDVDIFNNNICQNIINMNLMNNSLYILYNPCRCSTHQTS